MNVFARHLHFLVKPFIVPYFVTHYHLDDAINVFEFKRFPLLDNCLTFCLSNRPLTFPHAPFFFLGK